MPIQPLKWRKYLLLTEYGLLSKDELNRQIARYPRTAVGALVRGLSRQLAKTTPHSSLLVVKLVPPNEPGQLPNLRITTKRDLRLLPAFLRQWESYPYTEIWCCQTPIDFSTLNVAGRLVISSADIQAHNVEQLWRASPRMLEYFHTGSLFPHPYLRATRADWGWPFKVEHVHIPRTPRGSKVISRYDLCHEFAAAMVLIERDREQICVFTENIRQRGADVVSIEYKATGSHLSIIDWDTPNDRRVLG